MGKKKLIIVLVLIAAVIGIWFYHTQSSREGALKLYGNVDIRQVSLSFNAAERIASMSVEEGDRVTQGQTLAQLETTPLQLNISKLKAQVEMQEATVAKLRNGNRPEEIRQAEANVRSAESEQQDAALNEERMESLFRSNAVPKQRWDDASARLKKANAALEAAREAQRLAYSGARSEDITAAEAQLRSLQAELQAQEYNLRQATLLAPQNGVIRSRLLEPGDMASANKPVYLLSLDDTKWVRTYIPEKRLGEIKEGMQADIVIDSFPDKLLKGQVGYISSTAEFTPKSVQTEELRTSLLYEVRVYVKDEENVLRMGMPATVSFPDL